MARAFGRLLSAIWDDDDFTALDPDQQRLYMFLLSQSNLNHAGLLPLTLKRWARKAKDLTAEALEKTLAELDAARFIVVDDDTEEVLVRSYVRNDGVWKQPKVMGAMVSGAMEISSRRLRRALLAEMDRIPLDELSDEPTRLRTGAVGPSIREQVAEHIATLRQAFTEPDPDPIRGGSGTPYGPPSAPPSGTPSGTPSDTRAQGGREPSTRGRAGTHVRAAPAPAPAPALSPTPNPSPATASATGQAQLSIVPDLPADEPPERDETETEGQRINRLARVYTDLVPLSAFMATQNVVRMAVRAKNPQASGPLYGDEQITDGLRQVAKDGLPLTATVLRKAIEGTTAVGYRPYQNPTAPDAYEGLLG